jgi:hypothetical protein
MPFTAIEIIAATLAILGIIELIFILIAKQGYLDNVIKPALNNINVISFILIIIGIVIFYFLIQELTIVQIYAVVAFSAILMGVMLFQYSNDLMPLVERVYKENFSGLMWIYIIIWLVLSLWVIYVIFL